jgi:hypothetical protein
MRKKTFSYFLSLVVSVSFLGLAAGSALFAKEGPDKTKRDWGAKLYKPTGTPRYQILNINNLWTWARSDGQSNHSPSGDNGTFFPRGTAFLIYQDGIMWGGKAYVDEAKTQPAPFGQLIRVGGANYLTGCREGRVIGQGATAVPADPGADDSRIYRIRRDYYTMSETELRRDAAESNEIPVSQVTDADMQRIFDQYAKDWVEWPVDYGAPFIDRNGNGVYDPPPPFSENFTVDDLIAGGYDEPGVAGADVNSPADQVLWTVYNDLDREQTLALQGSEPLGLEVQLTVWGYKRTDPLGNIFFRRVRIINKGGVDIDGSGTKGAFWIDSMYVAQWSDPDLGSFADDLVGVDTVLSIGFVYNGNAIDSDFRKFNLPPPSGGYDFLQGPIIESPGDSAVFGLQRRHGYKNLGMTSFSYFSAGSAISDPPRDYTRGTLRWYKMLRGYAPKDGPEEYYPFPPGVTPGPFPLSGDPVTQTGFIDGQGEAWSFAPGDRRLNVSTGPFSLAPGDTQEVVVALVAGLGADRLSSVAVMKFNDRFAQNTYDALFQVPKPPVPPKVTVTELDGEVVLEWGSDLQRVQDTESRVNEPGSFAFEGYNVYQFPSRTASLKDAKRIATFDLISDPTVILDEVFDVSSGQILQQPVQFGSNSGIKRFFRFNRDYVLDIDKIYNGQEYYLAVTAYSHSKVPGYLPTSLESEPTIITVVPKVPFGKVYKTAYGDTLDVEHVSGESDGVMTPIVVDPGANTGDTYEIRFDTTGGEITWKLVNTTKGKDILVGQTNQSGDDNYDIVEGGIFLKVAGPPPGVKQEDMYSSEDPSTWGWDIPSGQRRFTWAGGADGFGWEGFRGAIGWGQPATFWGNGYAYPATSLKPVLLKLATVDTDGNFDPDDPNVSYAYRYLRRAANPPARAEFAPFILNPSGGYAFQEFAKSVPLSAWDISDPDNPRRLVLGHLENNVEGGMVDGKYWPPNYADANNTAGSGPREWLFIFDHDYSETPVDAYAQELIGQEASPIMYWLTVARRGNVPFSPGGSGEDQFAIYPNKPNTVNDVFRYTVPAPDTGPELEQFSAENVGVYPNPYYAFNPAEENRLSRFVTFNNLPPKVTVRIFNLGGQLVRTLVKDDPSQFLRWDLLNHTGTPVASGMYIAHVEMQLPSGGLFTKALKLAIIQEQEVLDVY